jgi:nitroreductase
MDLVEGIYLRRSVRAFTSRPVSRDVIKEILNIARWAPSAMNTLHRSGKTGQVHK